MDDFQTDSKSLLEFINEKCNKEETIDMVDLTHNFTKCCILSLINTYEEQQNIYYAISCCEVISYIFLIIYNYSVNIKLSVFMCERSALLFNEYLNISKNYGTENVNLLDVKQFIINKSIGPIISNNAIKSNNLLSIANLLEIIKKFLYCIVKKKINEDTECIYDMKEFLNQICCLLSPSFTNIYNLGFKNYLQKSIENIVNTDFLDIPREINLLKINLELLLYCSNKLKYDYNKSKNIVHLVMKNNLNLIDQLEDINDFLSCPEPLHDKEFFLLLINKLKQ